MIEDPDYFAAREKKERDAAAAEQTPVAKAAHFAMAESYAVKAKWRKPRIVKS